MFENIGWLEIMVLLVAALFILGPERLPDAASWLARNMRKLRDYATGARQQLKSEMGTDFDELRKPLEDLRGLRDNLDPKRAVRNFFDEEDSGNCGNGYSAPSSYSAPEHSAPQPPAQRPLSYGERPPFDPDAT